ncbi:histidine kinase [Pseudoalteromonas luteoviolacea]|uniref:sensor histidine kinase n=1 Tax=Pseudoalteromonas luteoviolacea TaxID=43657 RepID=UPI001EEE7529|nr:histidine kinase [Pseudoalteromonas luteoviolacea]MCF6440592.1 histidine kinase [Pseudoalteromonas luteoviolacea]
MYFFPRTPLYWFYHFSALIMAISVDLVTSIEQGKINIHVLKVSMLFAFFFTISTLIFRYIFNTRGWISAQYQKQIPNLLIAGTLLSILVSFSTITVCYYVDFYNSIYLRYIGENVSLINAYTSSFMLRQCLQTQLFICSWIFIYTSISHQKRAVSAKLQSLQFENSLKSAQLENLNTQLNPHFLFNTLNNIRFMIAESVETADDMMVTLSELLRYALEVTKQDKVSLNSEVQMLNKYMRLIKIQYEEKLIYHTEIQSGLSEYQVPPMMLQLLVENAVKYGIESSKTAGKINLSITQSKQSLILQLSNTVPKEINTTTTSMQIGLANIRERLSLLYGPKGSLETQLNDQQFIATLTLPKEVTCYQ